MEVIVNDIKHDVPFVLSDITLGKYIEYYDMYGRDLDAQLDAILKKDYKKELAEKFEEVTETDVELYLQMDIDAHVDNEALAWYSFFTGCDLYEVRDKPFIAPVLSQYRVFRFLLKESMEQANAFPFEIEWNDELWAIQNFTVNPASEMTFNEIITSKEVMRQIHSISKGKWDAMPYLCAIFLRKKGEAFSDEFIHEESDRLKAMNDLTMDHAMMVAFFLTNCVSIWSNTLAYSEDQAPETANQN